MKTIADLEAYRQSLKTQAGESQSGRNIIVGMATCGIAAGAQPVMDALQDECNKRGLHQTQVSLTGCIGICRFEPIVEVIEADGSKVTYVQMDATKARRVVAEHIVNGRICTDLTLAQAAQA